jgi:transposase
MNQLLVSDELWAVIAPLLPSEPAKPKGGRPRLDDRRVFTGIIFVLKSGIGWELLPRELGCGSGMTCWRRLRDWTQAGVWERLHRELLQRLADAGKLDWSRASLDSASVPAKRGARRSGRIPRIAANRVRSAIWSSIVVASRSRSCSRRPMCTIRGSWRRHWMPFRRFTSRSGGVDDLVAVQSSCMRTKGTTIRAADAPAASVVLCPGSRGAASNRESAWDGIAGWSSAHWPGSIASAASPFATSVALISTRRSFRSAAPLFAGTS